MRTMPRQVLPLIWPTLSRRALHVLEKLGARVVPVRMPAFDMKHFEAWFILASSEAAAVHERHVPVARE